jgi:hypothetical protein
MKPEILIYKTDLMTKLQHLISHAYTNYSNGSIEPQKLTALCYKFSDRYDVFRTNQQRWRAKKKGQANSKLVLWQPEKNGVVYWWLLATSGDGLIVQLEQLKDATNKRQRIRLHDDDYELVKTPRKDSQAKWTWRMTKGCYEGWQERIKTVIRHKDEMSLRQILDSLRRVPGFHDSRRQAFSLAKYVKAEWQRSCKGEFNYTDVFVGFVGKRKQPSTR